MLYESTVLNRMTGHWLEEQGSKGDSIGCLTTVVGSLFLAGLIPAGCAVCSLTARSPTLYRACGWRERQRGGGGGGGGGMEQDKSGEGNEMVGI